MQHSHLLSFPFGPLYFPFTDGFHSSASDPELQKKYGHIKPTINIAPPPTVSAMGMGVGVGGASPGMGAGAGAGGPPVYSMYTSGAPPQAYNYSRYVPYNPALPNPTAAQYSGPPSTGYSAPPMQPQPQAQYPAQNQPPLQPMTIPPNAVAAPAGQPITPTSASSSSGPPVSIVNKVGAANIHVHVAPTPASVAVAPPAPPAANVGVFDPATDSTLVLDASSSSVL
jgi:hypothetical protein